MKRGDQRIGMSHRCDLISGAEGLTQVGAGTLPDPSELGLTVVACKAHVAQSLCNGVG